MGADDEGPHDDGEKDAEEKDACDGFCGVRGLHRPLRLRAEALLFFLGGYALASLLVGCRALFWR